MSRTDSVQLLFENNMTISPETNNHETSYSLGELLQKRRNEKGMDLEDIAAETRISIKILRAMENGDYSALPANAFTRGFFCLYAQTLHIDTEEIMQMYKAESSGHPNLNTNTRNLPGSGGGEVLEFAERPRSLHFSSIFFILILLLLFGAFLAWYFSWNPATFLSQKLRGYEENREQVEQTLDTRHRPSAKTKLFKIVKVTPRKESSAQRFPSNYIIDNPSYSPHLEE